MILTYSFLSLPPTRCSCCLPSLVGLSVCLLAGVVVVVVVVGFLLLGCSWSPSSNLKGTRVCFYSKISSYALIHPHHLPSRTLWTLLKPSSPLSLSYPPPCIICVSKGICTLILSGSFIIWLPVESAIASCSLEDFLFFRSPVRLVVAADLRIRHHTLYTYVFLSRSLCLGNLEDSRVASWDQRHSGTHDAPHCPFPSHLEKPQTQFRARA